MPALGGVNTRLSHAKLFFSRVPFIDEIMVDNLNAHGLTYPSVFTVRNSSRAFETITGITGLGLFDETPDGDPITYDTILEAFDKRFEHLTYSKGVQFTRATLRDDIDGVLTDVAPAFSFSAHVSMETTIWNVFNNGFSTELTPDGVSLWNNAHVRVGTGTTFDNLIEGDLSVATLEDSLNRFADMTNQRGLPFLMQPSLLVAHPHLRWDVREILGSQLRSDTANNAVNAFDQISLKSIFPTYITGDDDWFVGVAPNQHKIMVYWREQPTLDHTMDFETGNGKSKMEYALSTGAAAWEGWVGSQGA